MSKYLVVVNDHKERSGVELDHLMATANGLRDPIKRLLDSEEKGCLVLFVPAGLELAPTAAALRPCSARA